MQKYPGFLMVKRNSFSEKSALLKKCRFFLEYILIKKNIGKLVVDKALHEEVLKIQNELSFIIQLTGS